jgi:Co/Zn/Cd efflux system component
LAFRPSTPVAENTGRAQRADGHAHRPHNGHSDGFVEHTITRSSEGVRAVTKSLAVLGATAAIQVLVFVASGSVALLADLIHNFGDALTAVPLAIAFTLQSRLGSAREPVGASTAPL